MRPIVNLIKLGRLAYARTLDVQHLFFNHLKEIVSIPRPAPAERSASQFDDTRLVDSLKSASDVSSTQRGDLDTRSEDARNYLILVEHEPVYTIGIRSKGYDEKYVTKLRQELEDHNRRADFIETSRGGLITFHGPGQLVAYPILYLGYFNHTIKNKSLKSYINLLERSIIDTLSEVGIHGAHTVDEYPGVWLDKGERKIAFIGVNCKRYVTMHGLSINYDCDLSWFDHIVSCGIKDKKITSVREELTRNAHYGREPLNRLSDNQLYTNQSKSTTNTSSLFTGIALESNMDTLANAFCRSFSQNFQCILKPIEKYYNNHENLRVSSHNIKEDRGHE